MIDHIKKSSTGPKSQVSAEQQSFTRHWIQLVSGGIGGLAAWPFTPRSAIASLSSFIPIQNLFLASTQKARLRSSTPLATFSPTPIPALFDSANIEIGRRGVYSKLIEGPLRLSASTAISFFIYDCGKRLGADIFHWQADAAVVHAQAAMMAAFATPSIINAFYFPEQKWKMSFLLRSGKESKLPGTHWPSQDAGDCRYNGPRFRHINTAKLTVHMVLYEKIKSWLFSNPGLGVQELSEATREGHEWMATCTAAGCAQLVAVLATYPFYRTNVQAKRMSLPLKKAKTPLLRVQATQTILGMYSGVCSNLLRSVPAAITMFSVYEFVVRTMT